MIATTDTIGVLSERFGADAVLPQQTRDGIPTAWLPAERVRDALALLKSPAGGSFAMLFDITAIDERARSHREGQPPADFTVVYHLVSVDTDRDVQIKVALQGETPSLRTITDLWPNADWYEREVWDMFGIRFEGHPDLRRLLMYEEFVGHPLRKDYPINRRQPLIGPHV
jgi:NADH-quinone oxidoreductase subunit C/D